MKVDIYIQKDRMTALVVPSECDVKGLPPGIQSMVDSAVDKKKNVDIGDPVIGLNREAAKRGISAQGYYVNVAKTTFCEG